MTNVSRVVSLTAMPVRLYMVTVLRAQLGSISTVGPALPVRLGTVLSQVVQQMNI